MIAQSNFEINEGLIYLAEAMKVEGYWSSKSFTLTIQNKDISFINHIENIVKKLNLNTHKRLLIKIRLPNKTKKEDVELLLDNKKINFHIEKSPFDNEKVKAVTCPPFKKDYNLVIKQTNNESSIRIICFREKTICKSKIECWTYRDLRFPTKNMLTFLDSYEKERERLLQKADTKLVASAFSALIDCEGSLDYYGLKRQIRVRMNNENYLKQWQSLLKKFNIHAYFKRNKEKEWEINISGWEDFDRLRKLGFKLHHSKKKEKWKIIMESFKRNQISRNSYKDFYVNKLRKLNKKVTAKEFANYLRKSKRTINHYLLKLEKQKIISCDRDQWPYLYFIST
jgi:hypothetical protein